MNWRDFDLTTIDLERLALLRPEHKCPPTYSWGHHGMGCAMAPPGYPSYFVQPVYTSHGNSPPKGPLYVLFGRTMPDDPRRVYHKVYRPLPIDHPRVIAWMRDTYRHFAGGYYDLAAPDPATRGHIAKLEYAPTVRRFEDDPRFSDAWREAEQAAVNARNAEQDRIWREIAVPENNAAVVRIRRYYPDHEPRLDWIDTPPRGFDRWWERHDRCPAPDECPGDRSINAPHRDSRCQFCGIGTGFAAEAK